jgi:hypothetical protein
MKVERIPHEEVQDSEVEPRMPKPDETWVPYAWGPYEHTADELKMMWSRIWRCFKSRKLCEGYLQHHKAHSVETWCAAFECVRQSKEGKFEHIEYVRKIAGRYEVSETPNQRAEREAREQQERLAMKAMGEKQSYEPSPKVREYWEEQSRTRSLDEIPSDHPDVIRMMRKLKGDRRK